MGFWDIVDKVLRWFEHALEENWLYIAVIVIFMLTVGLLIGGGVIAIVKAKGDHSAPDPERVFIESNAPGYCLNLTFNSWRWKENSTTNQFECYNETSKMMDIKKYLNMSMS